MDVINALPLSDANDDASDYDAAEEAVANLGRGSTCCLHDALRAPPPCSLRKRRTDGRTHSERIPYVAYGPLDGPPRFSPRLTRDSSRHKEE